jgi:nickel transport protein
MKWWAALLLLCAGATAAHEVDHGVAAVNAVSVTLTYGDGSPFAYEQYELYAEGKDAPAQVGNTDAQGRIAFIADDTKQWRVKAWSADGHGVDFRFASPAIETQAAPPAEAGPNRPNRLSLTLFGLGLLLAAFGLYQLFGKKR